MYGVAKVVLIMDWSVCLDSTSFDIGTVLLV